MANEIDLSGLTIVPVFFSSEADKNLVTDSTGGIKKDIFLSIFNANYNTKILSIRFGLFRHGNKTDTYEATFVLNGKPTNVYYTFLNTYIKVLKSNSSLFGIALVETATSKMHFILWKKEDKIEGF